jgi:hypothetical protein
MTKFKRSEKFEREAKKWSLIFEVNKRITCETDQILLLFANKRKKILSERAHPKA